MNEVIDMANENGIHSGHRDRVRARFVAEGLDSFAEHNILELVLFYSVPRKDTNELAHKLLNHFGSLKAVLDASIERLMEVPGVSYNTAVLLRLFPAVYRRYELSLFGRHPVFECSQDMYDYVAELFIGESDEVFYVVCLDGKNKVIKAEKLSSGSVNTVSVNTHQVVDCAVRNKAHSVVLAHNHPAAEANPSDADVETTKRIEGVLSEMKITLQDHIIIGGYGKITSMRSYGCLSF